MKTSRSGIEFIKRFEGLRLDAYPDPATGGDPWTVGYGHTSRAGPPAVVKGMRITAEQASEILVADLVTFEAAVMRHLKRVPTQHQFDAMVSLCYNIGEGNFKGSTVVREFNDGNIMGASLAFKMWNKGGGKILPGLIRRREAEAQLFRTPVTKTEPAVLADYETPTEKDTSMTINAPALSKINWTNIVAAGATLFSVFGLDVSPEAQVQIVTGIALASQVLSVIFRTFMTVK